MASNVQPLADRLRPTTFEELVSTPQAVSRELTSQILWGPPGCGKTSFARLLAAKSPWPKVTLSGVASTVQQFRDVFQMAERVQRVVLLIDEIHHLNKSQQDLFLPHVEAGRVLLLGTTTENPSFALRPALLSRCKVVVFERLDDAALEALLGRAEDLLERSLPFTDDARRALRGLADGDGRFLLNCVEEVLAASPDHALDVKELEAILQKRASVYDRAEGHYNLISALHKALRGSDVQASLYWLARMLEGGEAPLYIVRRLVRFAVEDVGMADPQALTQAMAAQQAYQFLGSPEGDLAIAQAVIYLATAPKSNAGYVAFGQAQDFAKKTGSLPPPLHILNAPTDLMRRLGRQVGYKYDHDCPHAFSGQNYFPEGVSPQVFYQPVDRGFERDIRKRLEFWTKLRQQIQEGASEEREK